MTTLSLARIWHYAISDGVPRRSLYVALIVGTILNLINQGDALLGSAAVNWSKLLLTFCIPYAVCTYGAVSTKIASQAMGAAPGSADSKIRF